MQQQRYITIHNATLEFVVGQLLTPLITSGYFTHVTTLAEVKEQVLKYVPVMARPMVMYRNEHPIQWTGVYADVEVSALRLNLISYLDALG